MEAILPFVNNAAVLVFAAFTIFGAFALFSRRVDRGPVFRLVIAPLLLVAGISALVVALRHVS